MRKGEILSLKWEQVDLNNMVILLGETKNGEAKGVPLNGTTVELLQELKEEQMKIGLSSSWVFPNPLTGKPYRKDANTAWRNAKKKAGITNPHFHDTRHTTV